MTIKFEPGQVYAPAHLRPFDLELALAGHPLAMHDGRGVRALRFSDSKCAMFDYWQPMPQAVDKPGWRHRDMLFECCNLALRLAPLMIKDGRPLHVGDEIELYNKPQRCYFRARFQIADLLLLDKSNWRWPTA